ncbi:MAG: MerR family transcriptional regulator [Paenibacillus sp.]|jgi:DNA-binding transcriptional MerR regulator|uniref:MerR family transcriptional regulator n=1 Tax=Paenibacillus sp. TaxID=58172 RepID=UPI00290B109E|nr:MerR family transcriptional regulator [Paenibacillus sp.]MDU4694452.1 MerR family transcriptional regulator [Paenibacillus sp.]
MSYTVRQVTELTGISPYTLRFYEKEGVLPQVERDANGVRLYREINIDWINTVQALRSTGLSLEEIKHYTELYLRGEETLQERKVILSEQRTKVEQQISHLIKILEKLNYKLALIEAQENKFDKLP